MIELFNAEDNVQGHFEEHQISCWFFGLLSHWWGSHRHKQFSAPSLISINNSHLQRGYWVGRNWTLTLLLNSRLSLKINVVLLQKTIANALIKGFLEYWKRCTRQRIKMLWTYGTEQVGFVLTFEVSFSKCSNLRAWKTKLQSFRKCERVQGCFSASMSSLSFFFLRINSRSCVPDTSFVR